MLFIAEAVTLAHVARARVLAGTLDPSRYDVHVAWDPRYNHVLGPLPFPHYPVHTLPTEQFLKRLTHGFPLHDVTTFRRMVADDLSTIDRVKPDLVVGDFRLSLAASARIARVPHIAIANAYWSPYGRQTFDFPAFHYPLSGLLGRRAAFSIFRTLRPVGFALHTRPLNRVLRKHGFPPIGNDIRTMYTCGDYTAYADLPELAPTEGLPATHRYIGAVLWSPPLAPPPWWQDLPRDKPIVYVTPGSSGERPLLPIVLEALSKLPVTAIAAAAGRTQHQTWPANARVAEFLPGEQAAARSRLVISNGGSPTTYQALAAGVPVLGLASAGNMDQHLNMDGVVRAGAGEILDATRARVSDVASAAERLLSVHSYTAAAHRLRDAHLARRAEALFPALVAEALEGVRRR